MTAKVPFDKSIFYRRQIIHSYEQEISSENETSSAFVYWEAEENVIGIIVFNNPVRVFEKTLEKDDRSGFLGNPASTLLEPKWQDGFKNKTFKIGEIHDDSIELKYLKQVIQIPRIEDKKEISNRQREMFVSYMKEIKELSSVVEKINEKANPSKPGSHRLLPTQQPPVFNRRRPNMSTGPSASKVPKQELSDSIDNE